MSLRYKKAETWKEKAWCWVAKLLHAKYVTPLGRIIILPKDYDEKNGMIRDEVGE